MINFPRSYANENDKANRARTLTIRAPKQRYNNTTTQQPKHPNKKKKTHANNYARNYADKKINKNAVKYASN